MPVREFTELEAAQQGQALGDSLPVGLRLLLDRAGQGVLTHSDLERDSIRRPL